MRKHLSFGEMIVREYTEVESGKKSNRPQLLDALLFCKQHNATLLIAKLDRLGRNVAFVANLMESGVDFTAVDNPHASRLNWRYQSRKKAGKQKRYTGRDLSLIHI